MTKQKAFCSWSGGKDSCLALHRAVENGYEITHLLTMFDETGLRSRSHSVSREVMRAQADALGLELITPQASWQSYETVFVEELKKLKAQNFDTAIFGDIDLQAHRDWEERVCAAAEIRAVLPLWNENRIDLVNEFFREGFRSVVICVNEKFLPKEFCGRVFDEQFVKDLPEGVDACGENGEFHTFVFDGKLFKNPVNYKIAEIYNHAPVFPSGDTVSFWYAELTL
ncbi:MAG TPA: diphthine--ammonia ligase [Pyrinomonadaceae bacterium]|nr:diphthine--ammonia ligase [Pyrinomonadaceae bacterium]